MDGAEIGQDCNICDHVFIESGAKVGSRVTIKNNALIWDGVTIEDDVFIGPNVVFTNDLWPRADDRTPRGEWLPTLVRSGASIGANVTVVCGITVGRLAMVGAGGLVVKSVADHALVVGSPARQIGWACRCGRRLPDSLVCLGCGRRYRTEAVGDTTTLLERET
jgi:acetyltransferase-like isoleucine patch superfamily enzyme